MVGTIPIEIKINVNRKRICNKLPNYFYKKRIFYETKPIIRVNRINKNDKRAYTVLPIVTGNPNFVVV